MKYITFRNSKLSKDNIGVFKLPAEKSCPYKGDCTKYCYAQTGTFRFSNVKNFMERSFELAKSDKFVDTMAEEIQVAKYSHGMTILRLHSSGDFFSQEYFDKWVKLAKLFPEITFYSYTKSLPYIKWDELPDNFIIIQSFDGRLDDEIDTSHKHAKVFPTWQALTEAGFTNASHSDLVAIDKRVTKVGLVAHGERKKNVV